MTNFFIHLDQTILFKALWSDLHFFRHLDQTSFVKVLNYHESITWKKPSTSTSKPENKVRQGGVCTYSAWTLSGMLNILKHSEKQHIFSGKVETYKSWGLWKKVNDKFKMFRIWEGMKRFGLLVAEWHQCIATANWSGNLNNPKMKREKIQRLLQVNSKNLKIKSSKGSHH